MEIHIQKSYAWKIITKNFHFQNFISLNKKKVLILGEISYSLYSCSLWSLFSLCQLLLAYSSRQGHLNSKTDLCYVYVCLHAWVYMYHMCTRASRGRKRVLDPLKLTLTAVVSHHFHAGIQQRYMHFNSKSMSLASQSHSVARTLHQSPWLCTLTGMLCHLHCSSFILPGRYSLLPCLLWEGSKNGCPLCIHRPLQCN